MYLNIIDLIQYYNFFFILGVTLEAQASMSEIRK
jgi:hypothetical protein